MTPKVFGLAGSPPFTAVLLCAKALGIEVDVEKVDLLHGEHLKGDFIEKNPQPTVPLLNDNGFILADSHAINGYLVGIYGKPNDPLYPKDDIKRRAIIDHRLHMDSSLIVAKGLMVSKPLVFAKIKPSREALNELNDAFSILDKQIEIQNSKYMVQNELSIADFSITASVVYWSYFVENWETKYPNIKTYINRMKEEPWYQTSLDGKKTFDALMEMCLKQAK